MQGWRRAFRRQAEIHLERLAPLAASGLPLISCETVARLLVQEELPRLFPERRLPKIRSLEGFLAEWLDRHPPEPLSTGRRYRLLPHCSEQTGARDSLEDWRRVFGQLGLDLEVIEAGCCGMSGLFGHERENRELSLSIFELGWKPKLEETDAIRLASGFSCRCQVRDRDYPVEHPAVAIDRLL